MIGWLLQNLERNPQVVFAERDLRSIDDAAFNVLRAEGMVRQRSVDVRWGTYSDVQGPRFLTVTENPDGSYEAFDEDDPEFEPTAVSLMDLPRWAIHLPELIRRLRAANQLSGNKGRLDERLFLLGTGTERFAIVLALLPNERLARPLLFGLPALLPPGYIGVLALCPSFAPTPALARELHTLNIHCGCLSSSDPFVITQSALAGVQGIARRLRGEALAGQSGPIQVGPGARSVTVVGSPYSFTLQQAQVFEILYENWLRHTPDVPQAYLLERLGIEDGDVRDLFRQNHITHPAWGTLIVPGATRGTLCLKV